MEDDKESWKGSKRRTNNNGSTVRETLHEYSNFSHEVDRLEDNVSSLPLHCPFEQNMTVCI